MMNVGPVEPSIESPMTPVKSNSPEQIAQQLGWDTTRIWATAAQVFLAGDHVVLVFREQVNADVHNGEVITKEVLARNVGSVVLPLDVARDFGRILSNMLPAADENA